MAQSDPKRNVHSTCYWYDPRELNVGVCIVHPPTGCAVPVADGRGGMAIADRGVYPPVHAGGHACSLWKARLMLVENGPTSKVPDIATEATPIRPKPSDKK